MQNKSSKSKTLFWARDFALVFTLLALGLAFTGQAKSAPFAYVTVYSSQNCPNCPNTIYVIDTAVNKVAATISFSPAIIGGPIAVAPDGKRVYVGTGVRAVG